ncbi:hypothetical protein EDB86DRAFT_2830572 [Lactarius hatsudake]|nr:hypothetical protein EDB86DRAFT_2830572 [Lactarius hatsudake]
MFVTARDSSHPLQGGTFCLRCYGLALWTQLSQHRCNPSPEVAAGGHRARHLGSSTTARGFGTEGTMLEANEDSMRPACRRWRTVRPSATTAYGLVSVLADPMVPSVLESTPFTVVELGENKKDEIVATTLVVFAFSSVLTGSLIGFFPRHILIGRIGGVDQISLSRLLPLSSQDF